MAQAVLPKRGEEEQRAPDSETSPQPPPEISKTLSEEQLLSRISEEREKRAAAERVLQQNLKEQERFQGLLGGLRSTFFDADGSARAKIGEEYTQLEASLKAHDETYLRAVGEYREATVLNEVDAQSKLYETEVHALSKAHKAEGGHEQNSVVRAWKAFNTWNSEWSAQKILGERLNVRLPENINPLLGGVIRFAGKIVTPRTVLALGLAGVGFGAYGIAVKGIEAGLGAVAGLATMRGFGVGVLTRDVMQWTREELPLMKLHIGYDKDKPLLQRIQLFEQLTEESVAKLSPEEVKQRLVDTSSAITLYGKTELLQDPRYQALLKAHSAQTIEGQRQFEEAEGEQPETSAAMEARADQYLKYLDGDIKELGSQIQKAQKEKKIKGVTTIALLTTAAVVLPGIMHLKRLAQIHPQEAMQLAKEAGKTVQEAFGSLVKFFDFSPPAWAETGYPVATPAATVSAPPEVPASASATASAAQAAEHPPAAKASGAGGEAAQQLSKAEIWGKKLGKGFSVSGTQGKFLVTAKIGGEGLLEKTTHQDQTVRVFLSRFYGDLLAQKYGGTVPKHALDAIENVIQNLKDPALVEKIVGEKVNIVSHDPADSTGRTLQIVFMGKDGEPLDKLMEHALKVATPNAGGTNTAHDLWKARLGHPVEDFKTGERPHATAPTGAGEPKAGVHPEAKPAVEKASGAGITHHKTPSAEGPKVKGSPGEGYAERISKVPAENIRTSAPTLVDQANQFTDQNDTGFKDFVAQLKTQGIMSEVHDGTFRLYQTLSPGLGERDAMLGMMSKLCIGQMEYLKQFEGITELRPSDKGTIYQLYKDFVTEGFLTKEDGRVVLSYDPVHLQELFEHARAAKHASVDRVAAKISPEQWNKWLSWEERPPVRPAVPEPARGLTAALAVEAAPGSPAVTVQGSGNVTPVIEAVPRSTVASPAVPVAAPTEAPTTSAPHEAAPPEAPIPQPQGWKYPLSQDFYGGKLSGSVEFKYTATGDIESMHQSLHAAAGPELLNQRIKYYNQLDHYLSEYGSLAKKSTVLDAESLRAHGQQLVVDERLHEILLGQGRTKEAEYVAREMVRSVSDIAKHYGKEIVRPEMLPEYVRVQVPFDTLPTMRDALKLPQSTPLDVIQDLGKSVRKMFETAPVTEATAPKGVAGGESQVRAVAEQAAQQPRAQVVSAHEEGPKAKVVKAVDGGQEKASARAVKDAIAKATAQAVEGGVEQKYAEFLNVVKDSRGIDPDLIQGVQGMKVADYLSAMEELDAHKNVAPETAFHQSGAGQYSREQYALLRDLVKELKPTKSQHGMALKDFLLDKWFKK